MIPDNFYDLAAIAQVAAIITMIVQYIKDKIPEWAIKPYLQLALGVVLFWAPYGLTTLPQNILAVIANGLLAGIFADGGYRFLSGVNGARFTFPSKTN